MILFFAIGDLPSFMLKYVSFFPSHGCAGRVQSIGDRRFGFSILPPPPPIARRQASLDFPSWVAQSSVSLGHGGWRQRRKSTLLVGIS